MRFNVVPTPYPPLRWLGEVLRRPGDQAPALPLVGAHKGRCFRHHTDPGASLPLPLGEGMTNLPQKASTGRVRVGVKTAPSLPLILTFPHEGGWGVTSPCQPSLRERARRGESRGRASKSGLINFGLKELHPLPGVEKGLRRREELPKSVDE